MSKNELKDKETKAASDPAEALARRQVFSLGVLGLIAATLQACNEITFIDTSKKSLSRPKKSGNATGSPAGPSGASNEETASSPPTKEPTGPVIPPDTECPAISTTKVNVAAIPILPDSKSPILKFYGNVGSISMVAIKLVDPATVQIVITADDGRVIALHSVSDADKARDGTFRPIVIDGLYLKGMEKIKIISSLGVDNFVSTHGIEFFRTYKGLPVLDLSLQVVPNEFPGYQAIARFSEISGFNKSATYGYPNANASDPLRPLYTAQDGATWTSLSTFKGEVVDVMGQTIASLDLLEHQTFCSYVLGTDQNYYRTMLRIG